MFLLLLSSPIKAQASVVVVAVIVDVIDVTVVIGVAILLLSERVAKRQ